MSLSTKTPPGDLASEDPVGPRSCARPDGLTVGQSAKMIDSGIFPDSARVELLDGILVKKRTKDDSHCFAVDLLADLLLRMILTEWTVREENAVILGQFWSHEPDLAVDPGLRETYRGHAPRADDPAILVEVADSSETIDRGAKWRRYAASQVLV